MPGRLFKDSKPGDVLSARELNEIKDAIKRQRIVVAQGSGLAKLETVEGTALRVVRSQLSGFLAVANGNIPARSGVTWGVGSVYMVTVTPTYAGGVLTGATGSASSVAYDVYNPSNHTMTSGNGIDSGMYCWVQEYPSGLLCVAPLECS